MNRTKGWLEAEISKALTRWEKEYLGRGSTAAKTDIVRDMIIVSLKVTLTPAEQALCETEEGRQAVKVMRNRLLESGAEALCSLIERLIGMPVRSLHTDLSTRTGERIIVFRLNDDLERRLMNGDGFGDGAGAGDREDG
ncbi:MAG: DUF2294 domain-containing protein [Hydrogenibacillus schlegelii]|nr:DUF2294 domain-containing protein [Hydrogenibacillus schlegelii]